MNSFRLEEIYGNGYERWAKVILLSSNVEIVVHFLEYNEYLENRDTTNKRKKDDILSGSLKIELITEYKLVNDIKSGFVQSIENSSYITAIGKVKEIEDSDTLICSINKLCENIILEFEKDINIKVGEDIEIEGSLELEIE